MKSKCLIVVLLFIKTLLFASNVMATENFDIYVNGSGNAETVSHLSLTSNSFHFVFRGQTTDSSMPGIGVLTGPVSELDEGMVRTLRERKIKDALTPYVYVAEPLRRILKLGGKSAKLDATTSLRLDGNQLLIDVAFSNSGIVPISFSSPGTWEGTYNPITKDSWLFISARRVDNRAGDNPTAKFSTLWLGKDQLVNKQNFPDAVLQINPGQTRHAIFVASPSNEFSRGRYEVNTMVSIRKIVAPEELQGYVEFGGRDGYVDFPDDYPSSVEQQRELGSHRKDVRIGE